MLWLNFLRAKSAQIGVFLLLLLIYIANFWLWHLPLMALFNSTILALLVFIIYLVSSYFRWKMNLEMLEHLTKENQELQAKLSQQHQAERELEDIIRLWSHQMKVPLAALDLMSQTQTIDEKELKNQLFSLENYLKMLLEYQRISNLSTDFHFEKISMNQLSKNLIKKYSSFFIQKGLSVKIEGEWNLVSDQKWLSLALEQLINNAVKYTQSGGITIEISPNQLKLSDTGIGILPEDLPRLFEHGFTGYNGRIQQKSTGLGLYLSKLIFDKLDFELEVQSKIDAGTKIILSKKM